MSSISVVQYQNAPQKLNVLQQSQGTNAREIIILRKPQQMIQKEVLVTNTARKKPKSGEKLTNPPPMAVARRNARERNRVKQVNNGFATLRQHIPNFIAAAFESNNGRGGNKKLSKVETLRMAVEYIRSLEELLSNDGDIQENTSTSTSYSSSTPSSPALTNSTSLTYTYPNKLEDEDSNISPSNYRRNYQIFYEDSENLDPIDQNLLNEPLIDTDIDLGNQELSLLNSMHTSGSLSPELYSDNSLSPGSFDRGEQMYIYGDNRDVRLRISPELMTDIKTEPSVIAFGNDEELSVDSKENMIQVMTWWEQQQTRS